MYQQDYRQGFKKDEQNKEAICYNKYEEDRKAYSCEKGLHLGKEVITL